MAEPLAQEIATYDREHERLEQEHAGKFVLIHGEEVISTYDTFEAAADEGLERFGDDPFLIRRVGGGKITLPPAVLYGITGDHP